ncbi:AAA family ATPase [Thermococcus sp. M36]|uniref:McrB family protein n=1 Tax=Thermococcus sp. M36 TaxID=1638261 RepID=UPI00143A57CC|nr:AAA family ATPase [Thermococcus sp. M36]NJE04599.1 AAA family ATPase [Thermococcus sp. M36]
MIRPVPMKTSMYSINRFLDTEYGDFGFAVEDLKLFPGGRYLAVLVRLDDDSRFIHVFGTRGQPLEGWEKGIPVPCADEVVMLPEERKLAVFTKCGTGEVKIYPIQSADPESEALSVTFTRLPLYVSFTSRGRLLVFCDYKVEYFAPADIEVIKIPTPRNGFAYIHSVKDTEDSLYLLYTFKENQKPRLELGRVPLPMFPYYSSLEFWDGIETLSKSSIVPQGGRPVGDIWLENGSFMAALGTKGGNEVYIMSPAGTKVALLPGELVFLSFTSRGLFVITGIYGGNLKAGLVPFDVINTAERIGVEDFRGNAILGRYVPGVVNPKFAGISMDGGVLYFGRSGGKSSGGTFYYFLRRDVDYLYQLEVSETPGWEAKSKEAASELGLEGHKKGEVTGKVGGTFLEPLLRRFKQLIIYGPPGTGKTYLALKTAKNAEFVTFHQSYSYEDFVEGFRPFEKGGSVVYSVSDGVFKRLAVQAIYDSLLEEFREHKNNAGYEDMKLAVQKFLEERRKGKKTAIKPRREFYMVIDEINRGNISRILGELITLLDPDKRLGAPNETIVTLPYSGELFALPPNLYIVATMNSADRSIAMLDIALRRRFAFVELSPDPEKLRGIHVDGIDLEHLLTRINSIIEQEKGKDYTIGHGYFLDVSSADDPRQALYLVFYHKVLPLFQEYFYGNWEHLRSLYPGFEFIDERGRIIRMNLDEFMDALRRLVGSE